MKRCGKTKNRVVPAPPALAPVCGSERGADTFLRRLLFFVPQQFGYNLVHDLINQPPDFVRQFGLNGMGNQNRLVLRHAKCCTLGMGSSQKLSRGHICGRDAFFFKTNNIVRTARNAAASIAEGFNHCIALFF